MLRELNINGCGCAGCCLRRAAEPSQFPGAGSSYLESVALIFFARVPPRYAPVSVVLLRQGRDFEAFAALFTMLTSFMYHLCDSIQRRLWMNAGQWHRLDNIGSILAFSCWFIFLASFRNPRTAARIKYAAACFAVSLPSFFLSANQLPADCVFRLVFLAVVLLCQEYGPWDERFTVGPILAAATIFVVRIVFFRDAMQHVVWRPHPLRMGLGCLVLAVLCFARGLDDATDPFRIFHGGWHFFGGVASYYLWQVKKRTGARRSSVASRAPQEGIGV